MAFYDRVRFGVSGAPGTGAITVGVAQSSFTTPAGAQPSAIANATALVLLAVDGTSWEIFDSVYTSSGTSCSRGTLRASSTGSRLSLSVSTIVSVIASADDFELLNMTETDVASAATCDIGAIHAGRIQVTGTTTITSFGTSLNKVRFVRFAASLKITYNATSLILPGSNNLTTGAGDTAIFASDGSGNWRCLNYTRSCPAAPIEALAFNGMQVNGGVDVSQEIGTTGATLTNNTAQYTADCWESMYNHAAATAVVTSGQVAAASFGAVLAGFAFAYRIKATTAITSPANGDFAFHRQQIEGYRVAKLGWGATGALSITIAFWFYSTASGVAFIRLRNSANNRAYHVEFTVAAGWNFVVKVIAGDTSGTWQKTTTAGLIVEIFAAGKAASPATPDAWGATPATQTTNSTNLLGTNNNETLVTGFVVLPGVERPSSDRLQYLMRSFDEDLRLCRRYYEKAYDYGTAVGTTVVVNGAAVGVATSTTVIATNIRFCVPKRTAPTMRIWSYNGTLGVWTTIGNSDIASCSFPWPPGEGRVSRIDSSSLTAGAFYWGFWDAKARL